MEKMGWAKGRGLGANENGSQEFIRVRFKNDALGLGYESRDDQWTIHEEGFNGLLQSLNVEEENGNEANGNASDSEENDRPMGFGFKAPVAAVKEAQPKKLKEKLSGISLEEKSKDSKARVHYKKFTRGKDLSQYSEKDLANIFGKKATDEIEIPVQIEKEEEMEEEKPVNPNFAGVKTVSTGLSVNDYFKQKMEAIKQRLANKNTINTTLNGSANALVIEDENGEEVPAKKKHKKKDKSKEELEITETEVVTIEEPSKKKKKSKRAAEESTNTEHKEDPATEASNEPKRKKKKKDKVKAAEDLTELCELVPALEETKNNKNEQSNADEEYIGKLPKKKSKKSQEELTEKPELTENTIPDNSAKKRKNSQTENKEDKINEVEFQKQPEYNELPAKKKSKKNKIEDKEGLKEFDLQEETRQEKTEKPAKKKSKKSKTQDREEDPIPEEIDEKPDKKSKKSKTQHREEDPIPKEIDEKTDKKSKTEDTEDLVQPQLQEEAKSKKKSKKSKPSNVDELQDISRELPVPANKEKSKQPETDVSATADEIECSSDATAAAENSGASYLSMEQLKSLLNSYNVLQISSFCAEKFHILDMQAFENSTLSGIPGYSFDENIELKIVEIKSDACRIMNLWEGKQAKYGHQSDEQRTRRMVNKLTFKKLTSSHIKKINSYNAFSGL